MSEVMQKIFLTTGPDGMECVATGRIPRFDEPPEVVLFGDRVFQYDGTDGEDNPCYIEVFAVALVDVDN